MNEQVKPDEAARALVEIQRRQEQAIAVGLIPAWYWWTIGALNVAFSAAIESRRPIAIGIGTTVFVLGLLTATAYVTIGVFRRAQVRNALVGPTGGMAIGGFAALIVGVSLLTAFTLEAAGVQYPATLGVLAGAVVMAVGGPMLMRLLRRIMLAKRVGGP